MLCYHNPYSTQLPHTRMVSRLPHIRVAAMRRMSAQSLLMLLPRRSSRCICLQRDRVVGSASAAAPLLLMPFSCKTSTARNQKQTVKSSAGGTSTQRQMLAYSLGPGGTGQLPCLPSLSNLLRLAPPCQGGARTVLTATTETVAGKHGCGTVPDLYILLGLEQSATV
jgi:hypothetical protein